MSDMIVITVHGIKWKSKGDWQNDLGAMIKAKNSKIKVLHFRYGYLFGVVSWWMSLTRFLKLPSFVRSHYIKKFVKFIKKIEKQFPGYQISGIFHSFGGWIWEQAMIRDEEMIFRNVILMHTPISCHIESTSLWNWSEFGRVGNLFAWSSHQDKVIGKVAVPPFGQNGYWGFLRMDVPEDRKKPVEKPYPINLWNMHRDDYDSKKAHGGGLSDLEKYFPTIFKELTK